MTTQKNVIECIETKQKSGAYRTTYKINGKRATVLQVANLQAAGLHNGNFGWPIAAESTWERIISRLEFDGPLVDSAS